MTRRNQRSIFVEPDSYTNQIIASELLSEEDNLYRDMQSEDGTLRTVWEFTPSNVQKLARLLMEEHVSCTLFVRIDEKLVPLRKDRAPKRRPSKSNSLEDLEPDAVKLRTVIHRERRKDGRSVASVL